MIWLIDRDAWLQLQEARKLGLTPTAEQSAEFAASVIAAASGEPRNLQRAGDVAQIDVIGILTENPDWLARYFGGGNTTYSDIRAALAIANADPTVKSIHMFYKSPGGTVDGLFETIDALKSSEKPIKSTAALAASAAFAMAVAGGKIHAASPASAFGSVGIVGSYAIREDVVEITSTAAPNKRPDPKTEEGKAIIRAELDELHQLFAASIAESRGVTVATVNETFGQGGMFLAAEAKKRGMIDTIAKPALRAVSDKQKASAEGGVTTGEKPMKWNEYKAAHPAEAAQAVQEGVTAERERVEAHLTVGAQCGNVQLAIDAIKGGVPFGHAPTQALYMGAAMARSDVSARASDEATAAAALAAAAPPAARDLGDQLADARLGAAGGK